MLTVIKRGSPIEEQVEKVRQAVKTRQSGLDAARYLGTIKSKIDPLSYQKQARDEW